MKHAPWLSLFLISALCATSASACPAPRESDAVAAAELVQTRLNARDFDADMCQEKSYIVLQWHAGKGYGSGQALAKKTGSTWDLVRVTTGSLKNAALLQSLGVPAATAKALANDIVPS